MIASRIAWSRPGPLPPLFATGAWRSQAAFGRQGGARPGRAAQTVKIAFIDPLSGPFAGVGLEPAAALPVHGRRSSTSSTGRPGIKFEIVPFDNKASPQESLTVLKQVIDQGIRYVAQGNGSGVALALIDAIEKHNERNPGKSIVFLNYAAVDPDLTNSKCSFWHFRFDANTDMKMEALTTYIKDRPEVKKVYLINQNYSFGQQVSRVAKEMLARSGPTSRSSATTCIRSARSATSRPTSPRCARPTPTRSSPATGARTSRCWCAPRGRRTEGALLHLLRRRLGAPTAMGAAGEDRVRQVSYWHPNIAPDYPYEKIYLDFKKRFNEEWYTVASYTSLDGAGRRHQARQLDRSAEGRLRDGRREAQRAAWRDRDARGRSPAAAAAVDFVLDQGRRAERHDIEKTGYTWKTEVAYPDLRRVAADHLPDEAPGAPQ